MMDGFWVCSLIKRDTRFKNIPIIIFSARAQEDDVKLGRKLGAEAYLAKPLDPKILADKVKEFLKA